MWKHPSTAEKQPTDEQEHRHNHTRFWNWDDLVPVELSRSDESASYGTSAVEIDLSQINSGVAWSRAVIELRGTAVLIVVENIKRISTHRDRTECQ